jgi:hypothetical protein
MFDNGVIYNGNQTNVTALWKAFYAGGEVEYVQMNETWMSVVLENTKICENEIPGNKTIKEIPRDEETGLQHNFFYYNLLVECLRKWNFVKCPYMKKSKECEELKSTMEHCNGIDYPLTHKILHEEYFYRKELNYGRDVTKIPDKNVEATTEEVTDETKEPNS